MKGPIMRIISWNCNGALRKKLTALRSYEADVYVIQECENPKESTDSDYRAWASNYLWVGGNKNKGLGVFAKPEIALSPLDLDAGTLESFIPCTLNGLIVLLAVWTRQANSPTFGYIGQLWKYLQRHKAALSGEDVVVIGDFNSNVCWDAWDRWWNHSDVVREFEELGIHSLYHAVKNEAQGSESDPTFYMHRKREKPYHIDYVFLSKKYLPSASLVVGNPSVWLEHSDHMPLFVEMMANPALQGTDGAR
jgi:exonuclease III